MRAKTGSALVMVMMLLAFTGCSDLFGSGYAYGSIEVTAVDQHGDPVFGVPLTLYGKGRHFAYGATDVAGRYVFEFVPFGGFGVEAGAPVGYRFENGTTQHAYADIEEGGEARMEFVLERVPDSGGDVPSGSGSGS